ncbi:hypothetical protein JXI42_07635 [bacterium]|nr:hypothetical protein [bacterium]
MTVIKIGVRIFVLILILFSLVYSQKNDVLFNALKDEIYRSLDELQMEDLEKPYFISCGITDKRFVSINASFGALTDSDISNSRNLQVDLRVGDYNLDNSNYGMDMFGTIAIGMGPMNMGGSSQCRLTTDDDYDILRHQIWYCIDQEYKDALEDYAGKQAALSTPDELEDYPGDLTKEEKVEFYEPPHVWNINKTEWENTIREVSGVFKKYPSIKESGVEFSAKYSRDYILNTEGTAVATNDESYTILLNATMQDEEGNAKSNNASYFARDMTDLPGREELVMKAKAIAESLKMIMASDTVGYYVGPVLFEGKASTQLVSGLLAKKIVSIDMPVLEKSKQMFMKPMIEQLGLGSDIGKKITARCISVYDDPTIKEYNGIKLAGQYEYDLEGVPAQKVSLIEDGILQQVLNHRRPSKKQTQSNGHARIGSPGVSAMANISNLFIKSNETAGRDEVKKQFLDLCKEYGLEYGIVVKDFYSPTSRKEMMKTLFSSAMSMAGGSKVSLPLEPLMVYKVDVKTGKETMLKNLKFDNIDEGILKDIILTSDTEFVNNSGGTAPQASVGVSVIAPEMILVEELALSRKSADSEEKPLIEKPGFK